MSKAELTQEWLVSNATVSFLGALLLGQAWHEPEGTVKLLFIFTVPDYTGMVILGIILFFVTLAVILVVSTLSGRLQKKANCLASSFSPVLGLFGLVSFLLGFMAAIPDLPRDQWWTWLVVPTGVFLFIFLLVRYIPQLAFYRN